MKFKYSNFDKNLLKKYWYFKYICINNEKINIHNGV